MVNRVCARCRRSMPMRQMERLGKDFVCHDDAVRCKELHYAAILRVSPPKES